MVHAIYHSFSGVEMKRLHFFSPIMLLTGLLIYSCNEENPSETPESNSANVPANPHPADNEDSVSVYTFLYWSDSYPAATPLTYDVYFGTSTSPPLIERNHFTKFYFPETLNDSATYLWKIIARDDQGVTAEGPIWQFHTLMVPGNNPPNIPSDPWPEDSATGIVPPVTLRWIGGDPDDDDVKYHVYWGLTDALINQAHDIDTTSYTLLNLTLCYRHYWKVIAEDEHGAAIEGPLWQFDAAIGSDNRCPDVPCNPSPPDGATGVDTVDVLLIWECSDPDGDSLTYTVRWGTTPMMENGVTDHSYNSWVLYNLEPGTQYYWWVTAKDEHDCRTPGPVWTFITTSGIPISNTSCYSFVLGIGSDSTYAAARAESWSTYLASSGQEFHFGEEGYLGQTALVDSRYFPLQIGVGNAGYITTGEYNLASTSGYSVASLRLRSVSGYTPAPYEAYYTMLPFNIEFYIEGNLAGQRFFQPPQDTGTVYEELVIPLDFGRVRTGSNIHVEFRSDRFKLENPVPVEFPGSDFPLYIYEEDVGFEWARIILE